MRDFHILKLAFITIVVVGALHFVAGAFYLYWTVAWFDYLMHFLGGLGGGLIIVWFVSSRRISPVSTILLSFVSVMFVGVLWEIFEYQNGITGATEGYALDTFHDLSMDALGVLVAGVIGIIRNLDVRS